MKNYDVNTRQTEVAVLIPCYNEEATIRKVVSDFRKVLPDAAIYVYDNNSTDSTALCAAEAGATVVKEPRQGKGNVVRSMFHDIEADVYLIVDGDDTYPAEYAQQLIEPVIVEGVDMVIGDRLSATYFSENKRRFHNFGNRIVRSVINGLFKSDIHDVLTGYRAFSREFVKNFPILTDGFEIETEMTIHALDKRCKIREIAVPYRDRPVNSVSKLNTLRDGGKVLNMIMILFKDYKPLWFFSIISVLVLILGVVMLVPVFAEYYQTGVVPRFPTLIAGCAVVLTAILLFLVGLILGSINNQNRRLYELMRLHRK